MAYPCALSSSSEQEEDDDREESVRTEKKLSYTYISCMCER